VRCIEDSSVFRRSSFALLLGLVSSLTARGAQAETPTMHENAIALNLGLGSAVGLFGVTFDRFIGPNAVLETGAGLGFTGPQLSIMPKLAFGDGHHSFLSGVGVAAGIYGDQPGYEGPEHSPKPPIVWWVNADLAGYQYRGERGYFLLAAGFTMNLNEFHYDIFGDIGGLYTTFSVTPQARLAFGAQF
jgi:hypothetical protein